MQYTFKKLITKSIKREFCIFKTLFVILGEVFAATSAFYWRYAKIYPYQAVDTVPLRRYAHRLFALFRQGRLLFWQV